MRDPVWAQELVDTIDMENFRADNPYVWQLRGENLSRAAYEKSYSALRANDRLHLLDRLVEDDRFGVVTFEYDGATVSRDLLDSIAELDFLDRHVGLEGRARVVLDIGAGYGRLAHRAVTAFPNVRWASTDAIAVSTYLAETYLAFRGVGERAPVIPLDEVEEALTRERFDLAVNVHSFSECTVEAIGWWTQLLARAEVPKLFVVPNAVSADGREALTNRCESMNAVFMRHGYRLATIEPKYRDATLQQEGLSPTGYFLFELVRD